MPDFHIGQTIYRMTETDGEAALAHAIGRAFIELQQLEYCVVSFLNLLSGGSAGTGPSFDLFASKTFGNLLRAMRNHTFLDSLADEMHPTKERRDHFVHRFLFHRYGGAHMTTDAEYEILIRDANELGRVFRAATRKFEEIMLDKSALDMFVATVDTQSGEITIRRSSVANSRSGEQGSND